MEPLGFKRGMNDLLDMGIDVEVMATNHSTSIQKIMREDFTNVQHEFDIWQTAKGMYFYNLGKHTQAIIHIQNLQPLRHTVVSISFGTHAKVA